MYNIYELDFNIPFDIKLNCSIQFSFIYLFIFHLLQYKLYSEHNPEERRESEGEGGITMVGPAEEEERQEDTQC